MNDSKTRTVLLVAEDHAPYTFIINAAIGRAHIEAKSIYVSDGQEVIDYLEGKGRYADRNAFPLPHLAVLDLKMPRMTGLEALDWIRRQPRFKDLPVMILTSSECESDMQQAQELEANCYVIKPANVDALARALREFIDSSRLAAGGQPPSHERPNKSPRREQS